MRIIIGFSVFFASLCLLACCKTIESKDYGNFRLGYEYLSDSIYSDHFYFFNKNDYELVSQQMVENAKKNNRKYHNHFLYCLDTVSNYKDFVCFSAEYFERLCPIAWGVFYTNCELVNNDTLSVAEFDILKFNTIHGASLIVNSCLFDSYIPFGENKVKYQDDEFFLFKKYYIPYLKKEKLSDSLMLNMLSDIEKLCAKYESK